MSRIQTKRANAIDSDFSTLEKDLPKNISALTVNANLSVMMTGLLHDNILNNKGDLDEADRAVFAESFTQVFADLQAVTTMLSDCYAVYDDDPTLYAENLANFIVKYPSAASEEVEKRYS